MPRSENLFIGGDFNGHIGAEAYGYDSAHRGFGLGREIIEESLFWTSRLPMGCQW